MSRWDDVGLLWEDLPSERTRGARVLGPLPPIPDTGWLPPSELPNIRDAPWIGIDCETYDPELMDHGPGWARGKGHIVGISIAVPWGKWYFPIRHTVQPELNMDPERILSWLRVQLAGNQPKIGAHLMYDIGWLAQEGVTVNGPLYDVQYAEGLLDETARVSLESLGWKYLRRGKLKDVLRDWIMGYYMPPEKFWRREIYRSPITMAGPYAEEDAAMPYEILMKQWPQLVARGLLELFEMECKLIRLLIAMRFAGITVNVAYAEECKADFTKRVEEIHKQAEHIAGVSFNANAADSLAVAFDRHNIPYQRTKPTDANPTGRPSFTADFLKTINHPLPQLILQERQLSKLTSTFIDGYILNAHVNGKVYCSFHPMVSDQGGAKTGRFSSSTPNLQNIPIRTAEGRKMRGMFTYDNGHVRYRSGDYSQIEYRMLAHFATGEGADDVRKAYNSNPKLDYHDMISVIINTVGGFSVQLKNGTVLPGKLISGAYLIREHIKTLNFAMVYGVGKDALAEMLGVSMAVAVEISNAFHKTVTFARSTMNDIAAEVGQSGLCTTVLNRQTHFDLWEPDDWNRNASFKGPLPYHAALEQYGPNLRRAYLYAALNYRLQGSAADVMKKAMLDCWENGIFAETGVPRLTCHDELGFSDPGDVREDAWRELVHTMENTIKFRVPIRFDFKSGETWRDCK